MDDLRNSLLQSFSPGSFDNLVFRAFSSEEIKRLSVVKIVTPLTIDTLGKPLPGSLYDIRLGPFDTAPIPCVTCGQLSIRCPGHFGHIELPLPVINPLYFKVMCNILKITCMKCFKIVLHPVAKELFVSQIKLLNEGLVSEAMDLSDMFVSLDLNWQADDGISKIKEFMAQALKNANPTSGQVIEVRGDGDYRGMFLREATAHAAHSKLCPFCQGTWKLFFLVGGKMFINSPKVEVATKFSKKTSVKEGGHAVTDVFSPSHLMPSDAMKYFREIWNNESSFLEAVVPILKYSKENYPTDLFFMTSVLVSPTNSRPINYQDGMIIEHPQNGVFKSILNSCLVIRSLIYMINNKEKDVSVLNKERLELVQNMRGANNTDKLNFAWQELQISVDSLLDASSLIKRKLDGMGLKQVIEKKEGMIRMHMMGKRVNFAARSVITPDPNLSIDEIGVPEEFAKNLSFPVPVTEWNVVELRKKVINGPDVHPGANVIQNDDGSTVRLSANDKSKREAVAKKLLTLTNDNGIKILFRHLVNGDILLMNRQPTLHRPSIMAHKVRILKGEKTFRLHYANCKSYNADFDGDEMNAHFPQNEVARSEAYNLVNVANQYLVPKDGSPLSGLIQDHVVSGVRLSIRGKFFKKSEYMQLVFQGLSSVRGDIKLLPPAIIKPEQLWSGKQVISTVIINIIPRGKALINLSSQSKITYKAWEKCLTKRWRFGGTPFKDNITMTEAEVIIRGGELLSGVLDKTHFGSSSYSLVHCLYELYGGDVSCKILSAFSKLFTSFLQIEGFTLGVEDILVLKQADKKRRKIIKDIRKVGIQAAAAALEKDYEEVTPQVLQEARHRDPDFRAVLDREYKLVLDSYTNEINKTCLSEGLLCPFPDNNLQLMVQSGAKGSTVNTMQISCLLGQIELEGKRPPLMISGKSLPSFVPFDISPRAGGFIEGRFLTGIKPQEFFFHCMAGREGLIDTACKTSRSGYLQRCLVKHLEGLSVHYDMTVRDSDGAVVQFLYGEDGLDICKSQFLKYSQLPFLMDNMDAITKIKQEVPDEVRHYKKKLKKWMKDKCVTSRVTPFNLFCSETSSPSLAPSEIISGRSKEALNLCQEWYNLDFNDKHGYVTRVKKVMDPVQAKFQPGSNYSSISEKLDNLIENYIQNQGASKKLRNMIYHKAQLACAHPGEPVGLLAAQSIGEPSTQMTLNTFHFAGRGEMNVTLGIPRLRELLMVASKNIKTPSMEIPFRKDIINVEKRASKLKTRLNRVNLADVLESITVTETLRNRQIYNVKMKFLPKKIYKEFTHISPQQILRYVEKKFVFELTKNISRKHIMIRTVITTETEKTKKEDENNEEVDEEKGPTRGKEPVTDTNYESSDEEPEGEDDDATTARRRQRQQEEQQYSDIEDIEDEEVAKQLGDEDDKWANEEGDIEGEDGEKKKDECVDDLINEDEGVSKESVIMSHPNIENYKYDNIKYSWCAVTLSYALRDQSIDMSGLLKELAKKSVVFQIQGIKKAHISKNNTGEIVLKTEGINFNQVYGHSDLLDIKRMYCNDVHAMASTYGIEAAVKVLVKEIQNVFKVYGITVDSRHLSLVADYMTFLGMYIPINRKGMEGGVSPLQQMSFESSLGSILTGLLRGKIDSLSNPSAKLMVGKPFHMGTGCFDLIQDLGLSWK